MEEPENTEDMSSADIDSPSCLVEEEDQPSEKQFSCTECDEKFIFHYSLTKHIKKTHLGDKPHICTECGKRFCAIYSLKRHMLVHTGEKPHVCPLCQQSFSQDNHLTRHLRRHFNDRPYQCSTCGKSFTDSGVLRSHMRIHSGEKPYGCSICQKRFTQSGSLERHLKIHTTEDKVFKCSFCDKEFSSNSHLHSHLRVHDTEKKFECTFCCKKYSSFSGHYKHMKIHEREGNYGVLKRRSAVSTGEKKYKCSECNKKFQSFSGHYKHMKTHERKDGESDVQGAGKDYVQKKRSKSTSGVEINTQDNEGSDSFDSEEETLTSTHGDESDNSNENKCDLKEMNNVYIREVKKEVDQEKTTEIANKVYAGRNDEIHIKEEPICRSDEAEAETFAQDSDLVIKIKSEGDDEMDNDSE